MGDFEPKQFGKYLLLKKLAVGGMAEIYRAKTYGVDGFEKELVIKRILPHCSADKDFIDMLIQEAKLSVLLSHANIVQVYDLSKVGDDYYIAMELIHGVNLRDIMYRGREAGKPLPTAIAVYIASEICKGLDYAHRKTDQSNKPLNIVHRDISPQNILLSYEGEVKIVDFGIAKAAMNISHTLAGILKGKIAYMSPEQAMGSGVDGRTDIFSTGILLYEMLAGQKLFTGESQFEVLKKIRTTRVTEESLPESIPEQLKPIVVKALAYEAEGRYQTAGDMQIDLTKYLYTNHVDFSPRKLAQFIKEIFLDEMRAEQEFKAKEVAAEVLTGTMNVNEGAKQVSIVHREVSAEDDTARTEKPKEKFLETMSGMPAPGREKTPLPRPRKKPAPAAVAPRKARAGLLPKALAAAAILIAVGWLAWRFIPSVPGPDEAVEAVPEAATGSVRVVSTPEGALILRDGESTGLTTPAVVGDLAVDKNYRFRVEKEEYSPAEMEVAITGPEEKTITLMLAPSAGTLNISTEPSGASIFIDGKQSAMTTPAALENLPLNTDIRVVLSKPEFEDFEQVVNLTSPKPQGISTKLKPIVARLGRISISSTPEGAKVFIDGKDTGRTTPAVIANLAAKRYTVSLSLDGFEQWSSEYDVAGEQPVPVQATLLRAGEAPPAEKREEPAGPTTPEAEERPAEAEPPLAPEEKAPPEEEKKPAEAPATGTLKVSSTPSGALIKLNGASTGKRTPNTLSDLKIGATYTVGLELDGYKPGTQKKYMAKESESVSIRLSSAAPPTPAQPPAEERRPPTQVRPEEEYGELSLSSDPPAAQVIIDGQAIPARTPVTIRKIRTDRPHTVTIQLPGYKPWTRSFNMDGKRKSLHAPLQPE
ncbi:MAG: serine/threonine protein kinase [Proteobacteria bacterium]|nr:serine/threonine protein kinase [Pseudomonadota bacterium]